MKLSPKQFNLNYELSNVSIAYKACKQWMTLTTYYDKERILQKEVWDVKVKCYSGFQCKLHIRSISGGFNTTNDRALLLRNTEINFS